MTKQKSNEKQQLPRGIINRVETKTPRRAVEIRYANGTFDSAVFPQSSPTRNRTVIVGLLDNEMKLHRRVLARVERISFDVYF